MHYCVLFLAVTTVICCVIIQRCALSPLRRCPGPFLPSISRLWYTYINWRGIQHKALENLHAQYGEVVRVAPNEVCVALEPQFHSY